MGALTALDFYGVNATHSLSGSYIVDYTQIVNDGILCAMDSLMANLPDPTGKYYYRMDTVNEDINEVFWTDQYPQCWNRACHGIDLVYSHRATVLEDQMDNETLALSKDVQSYWTNFAKYADPNGEDLESWPEYTRCGDNQLIFNHSVSTRRVPHSDICSFWNAVGYVPPYNDPSDDTTLSTTTAAECGDS